MIYRLDLSVLMVYLDLVQAGDPLDGMHLQVEGARQDPDHFWVLESHQGHPVLNARLLRCNNFNNLVGQFKWNVAKSDNKRVYSKIFVYHLCNFWYK